MRRRKGKVDNHDDASPAKSLVDDLGKLRRTLRQTARAYTQRLDQDIGLVIEWAHDNSTSGELTRTRLRDLGDMISLVRKVEAKPEKGRKKDLKKIDAVVTDLRFFVERAQN